MAAVIVASSRLGGAVEAGLPRGLHEFLILFQVEHGLLADTGKITLAARAEAPFWIAGWGTR